MLRRVLGPIQIQLISLGGIIGSAYFLGVGSILQENGPYTILAFILGGLIVWLVAMAMGEVCVAMPREGSFVSQSRELIGRPWAAGVGWSYWFNWCAYIPSEMLAGGMILHQFVPQVSVIAWASLFATLITVINLIHVKNFGNIESAFALLKIGALTLFTLVGLLIWTGILGNPQVLPPDPDAWKLPGAELHYGAWAFLITMVLVLVNFQGTELIALTAAETHNPQSSIPRATRNVAMRIIALFVIPITLVVLIFPSNKASVDQSVFVEALSQHGFSPLATFFQFMIVTAALSCANSGLYGAVRSLYGLGKEGLAPRWVTHLNANGTPAYATWLTIAVSWSFLPLYFLFEGSTFYTWLISVSGFTGAICWISITACQIQMRRDLKRRGISASTLPYRMPGFPYLSWVSLLLQLLCLSLVALHPTLRASLALGIPAVLFPALICWLIDRRTVQTCPELSL